MNKFEDAIINGHDPLSALEFVDKPIKYPDNYENPGAFALRCTLREVEHGMTYPDNFPVTMSNLIQETLEKVYFIHTGQDLDWQEILVYDEPEPSEGPF